MGRLRLRCARSLSQVVGSGTECVAALAWRCRGRAQRPVFFRMFSPLSRVRERGGGGGPAHPRSQPHQSLRIHIIPGIWR
ncbi:hypothetical protein CBM2592_A220016 [Cupriavidus taiwanensis]|nr:hypothetical protein CBM2592_A220016 [Cupriavidus taiwanensis]SOY50265.1 hypothetical protein CBM2588_A180017 [Cupriavidus taiwanensis]SOY83423.1 hypothetical protein CBM2591_A260016 [Cupriavidus taiwanensis]SOZ57530.1 hypothetical protein CBM2617_A240016 [Cupriavidus taiwanensis]SOZ79430.1 hypothetical protein CBM2618_A220016 [Cupriavidus taiwanensis]